MKSRNIYSYITVKLLLKLLIVPVLLLCMLCVRNYQYNAGEYDCRHMSRDVEDSLENIGFNITLRRGESDDGEGHIWLVVNNLFELDSVTLLPLHVSDKYPKYQFDFDDYEDYQEWKLRRIKMIE